MWRSTASSPTLPPAEGTGGPGPNLWFPSRARLPSCDVVLRASPALGIADELVAPHALDHAFDHIQVATTVPPYHHVPGGPHIDGHRPGPGRAGIVHAARRCVPHRPAGLPVGQPVGLAGLAPRPSAAVPRARCRRAQGDERPRRPSCILPCRCPPRWRSGALAAICSSPTSCSATTRVATRGRRCGGRSTTASPSPAMRNAGRRPSSTHGPSTPPCEGRWPTERSPGHERDR